MRKRAGAALTGLALVAAVAGFVSSPASGQTVSEQQFGGYGSGTVVGLNALGVGSTITANVQSAHSAGAVNSKGLTTATNDELGQNVNPARGSKDAYGRGAGVEVGLLTGAVQGVDVNQVILTQLAAADAPPPTGPVVKDIPVDLTPILSATTAHGEAKATFDANTCVVGRPMTFGRGFVENLLVVNQNQSSGLVASNTAGDNVSESRTVTYLTPNGDGTFGMVAETRLHVAPISLLNGAVTIQVAGELVMRTIATGKPGGARVEYPGTPVLTISLAGVPLPPTPITMQSLLGSGGLNLSLGALGTITLGTPPHAIGGAANSAPVLASDGTSAAAAVDAARVSLLQGLGLNVADLRVGHIEGAVSVPAGGIKCNIPVSKASDPSTILTGGDFTITIAVPSDANQFAQLFGCDLVGIQAVDVHTVASGTVAYTLTGASNNGTVNSAGDTVTWTNVGNYRIGDPPILLTVKGHVASGAGVLRDTVNVTATLGNCEGTGNGQEIVGSAVAGGKVTGTQVLDVDVTRAGVLAATGGDSRLLAVGGLLLLSALGVYRRLRRPAVAKG